jgi:hypothetical protein
MIFLTFPPLLRHSSKSGAYVPAQTEDTPGLTRFTLRDAFVALTILILVFGFILIGSRDADKRVAESNIRTCMRSVDSALKRYAELHGGSLPERELRDAQGKSLSSWRFQVFPHSRHLWDPQTYGIDYRLDLPWEAKANQSIANCRPLYFCADRARRSTTNVFAVTGTDTAFHDGNVSNIAKLPSVLIVAAEVNHSNTHWMQPGDYDVGELLTAKGRLGDQMKGILTDRVYVLFVNGEVWALSPDTPMTAIHPFLTITGAKNADRDELLATWRVN